MHVPGAATAPYSYSSAAAAIRRERSVRDAAWRGVAVCVCDVDKGVLGMRRRRGGGGEAEMGGKRVSSRLTARRPRGRIGSEHRAGRSTGEGGQEGQCRAGKDGKEEEEGEEEAGHGDDG